MPDKDRERLAEVMARAAFKINMPEDCVWEREEACAEVFLSYTRAAIAAAERAGFRWEAPDTPQR